jgi:hypothetical protein
MTVLRDLLALSAALVLAGCSSNPNEPRMFGLVAAEPPPPQPFVVAARPRTLGPYPAVGITPPPRTDRVLTEAERAALEAQLKAQAAAR